MFLAEPILFLTVCLISYKFGRTIHMWKRSIARPAPTQENTEINQMVSKPTIPALTDLAVTFWLFPGMNIWSRQLDSLDDVFCGSCWRGSIVSTNTP
jgi:hypothetical protein